MRIRMMKKIMSLLLALALLCGAAPLAGAWYQCDQTIITGEAPDHVAAIMADIDRQSFESEEQRAAVKAAVKHLLSDSSFSALNQGRFPYFNANGYATNVDDGVYSYNVYASGCYAYAKWAEQVVYGKLGTQLYPADANGNPITGVWSLSAEGVKDFIRTNCQAGEHLRIDYVHSVCFLACTDEGVYFADYAGDSKPIIRLCYATYEAFFNAIRTGSVFWMDDVVTLKNGDAPVKTVINLTVGSPNITVNGSVGPIDAQGTAPIIVGDRTLLPIRAVIEAMGGQVKWDGATKTVSLILEGRQLNLSIDSTLMWDEGNIYRLDTAPTIIGGRTMVPLRAVVEYFGATVSWEGSTKTATISYVK